MMKSNGDDPAWRPVTDELERWKQAGRTAGFWLRDDDACAATPALHRLLDRAGVHRAPILLAVVPMKAEPELAALLRGRDDVDVAMHGAWHANHASEGARSSETPAGRTIDAISAEWREARARLTALFGPGAGAWYVPPWNRMSDEAAAILPEIGFSALSVFRGASLAAPGLRRADADVDLIDWRGGRRGRTAADIAAAAAAVLAAARQGGRSSIGILSHHLDHDDAAWSTLEGLLEVVSAHPSAGWISPGRAATP
jgi:peptidoglycan/xylan/chitin deacetylase (PgdA/CDA1 family)